MTKSDDAKVKGLAKQLADRVAELEAALRPFAEHGAFLRRGDRAGGARKVVYEARVGGLTLGDFDRARALVEREQ